MKLILIRHGDPDYPHDTLSEKGWREAALLAGRVAKWPVRDFYCSPLGRAKDTAQTCLQPLGREMVICDWLKEFYFPITDPVSGRQGVPWDFVPSFWTGDSRFFDRSAWLDTPVMQQVPEIKEKYHWVCTELDKLLAGYGYIREGGYYRVPGREEIFIQHTAAPGTTAATFPAAPEEDVVVMFAHLGIICVLLSHLLSIPFPLLPQGLFLAPTSVTVLATEERWSNEASFRIQVAGDTTHLRDGGEPVSCAGAYFRVFEG
jgi:probable phosphoglycerate mutase